MYVPKSIVRTATLLGFCVRWGFMQRRRDGRSGRAEDLLPPVEGCYPREPAQLVVFAAADPDYLQRFGERFVRSVVETSPDVRLHLHCFGMDEAGRLRLQQWQERWPARFTWTMECVPAKFTRAGRTIYFQSVRFVRVAQLIDAGHTVLALDIDCIVHRNLKAAIARESDADIGLFLRPGELDPARRVLAACFYARPTAEARIFLARAANMIGRHLALSRPCVKLDQMSLYWAYLRRSRRLRIWSLPQTLADWDMQPGSIVWTAKGNRKNAPHFAEIDRAAGD
jgi:hypothetical protein